MKNIICLLLIIVVCLLFVRQCNTTNDKNPVIIHDTITTVDIIEKPVFIEKIKPIYIVKYKHDTVIKYAVINYDSIEVDTSFAIDNYYSISLYNRVLKDDSIAFISLIDTIRNGELQQGLLTFKLRYQPVINKVEFRHKLYAGIKTNVNKNISLSPSLIYARRKVAYSYGYDIINRVHEVGIYTNIFK